MREVRVMHYLNQFFVGLGGEEKADVPLGSYKEPVGPGKGLQALLGDAAKIVVTVYCGDNYFSEHHDEVMASILKIAQDNKVEIVVAGPAFHAGRYGFACVEICHFLSTSAGLYCVSGMYAENPALAGYKQYKDEKVFIFPTRMDVAGMNDALAAMAKLVLKLAAGSEIGPASKEGYIPRGIRVSTVAEKSGAERVIDMLLDKVASRSFTTEVPVEVLEKVPVAPPIASLKDAKIALGTTAGVVPQGNPDRFTSTFRSTHMWKKYSMEGLESMQDAIWEVYQGGMHCGWMIENANYGIALDVSKEMEREGVFAKLYPSFYSTVGVGGVVPGMQTIGREMAVDMKSEGVQGVLLVST